MESRWYEHNYRRHLCDMHIADWDDAFLSKFSAEEYLANLKRAHVSSAMIYYQSHVGLCYFPTKVARMHKAFIGREDEMKRLTDMCHAEGIAVVGYYSLNYNTLAHDEHPDWRMVLADGHSRRDRAPDGSVVDFATAGGSRYGLCCPNNPDYRAFVFTQIDEMLDFLSPDALFFDMLFWPHPCYCKHCRARWQKETGSDILPTRWDYDDPTWRAFCDRRNAWMGEWAQAVTDYVKTINPKLTVEHNVSAAANEAYFGTGTAVNNASEFAGGDRSGGLLDESVTCKLYRGITKHQPFEYMFPKCEPSLFKHTLVKTDDHVEAAVMLTAAHHGAVLVIDAIDPDGSMHAKSYDGIGKAFRVMEPYEKYFRGELVADVGAAYGLESKGANGVGRFGNASNNTTACVSLIKNMIEAGIAVDVIASPRDLSAYKIIFAPTLWESDRALNDALLDYAAGGGTLVVTGPGDNEIIEKATGAKVEGLSDTNTCYFAPEEGLEELFGGFDKAYPLQVNGHVPLLSAPAPDAKVLATLVLPYTKPTETRFASIHSDPPGIRTARPAVIERPYGKGTVIYSAGSLENESYIVYQNIVRGFIDRYVGLDNLTVRTDAPTDVETVTFRDGNNFYVSNALLLDPKNKPHMPSFTVRVRTERAPKAVKLLPAESDVPFTYDGTFTVFTTRETRLFDMYKIEG